MTLPKQPKKIAIIGAGAIGCEFADFYSSIGSEVCIVEMMDNLLPIEDADVSVLLERIFAKRKIDVRTKTKTEKIEKTEGGVRLTLTGAKPGTVDADLVLVAVGVTGNVEGAVAAESKLEIVKNRVKVDSHFKTNLENVWAIGDCIAVDGNRHPDLAHVAHHEAVHVVEHICGVSESDGVDYQWIPGCTYTHPQVASFGMTEKIAREKHKDLKIGKFPLSASGRALAAGETDGFVKMIFESKYGDLLGAHMIGENMIGENVTELLAELVLAKNLEATEQEIVAAMHPHPTMSEAIMEAAGVAMGKAIHL
jgi:dihydrolipoamide dehydrogenase